MDTTRKSWILNTRAKSNNIYIYKENEERVCLCGFSVWCTHTHTPDNIYTNTHTLVTHIVVFDLVFFLFQYIFLGIWKSYSLSLSWSLSFSLSLSWSLALSFSYSFHDNILKKTIQPPTTPQITGKQHNNHKTTLYVVDFYNKTKVFSRPPKNGYSHRRVQCYRNDWVTLFQ